MRKQYLLGGAAVILVSGVAATIPARDGTSKAAAGTLAYSGVLTDADGTPLKGTPEIFVQFWKDQSGAERVCSAEARDELKAGSFRVTVSEPCSALVSTLPEVWVETRVDGQLLGARSRLSDVPRALHAEHSKRADEAAQAEAASGALQKRIEALESTVQQLKGGLGNLVQTGIVKADANDPAWTLDELGPGAREFRQVIPFPQPFSKVPQVVISLHGVDVGPTRVATAAGNVTATGFELLVSTWADSKLYGVNLSWVAFVQ
jgi:hypothetical protein